LTVSRDETDSLLIPHDHFIRRHHRAGICPRRIRHGGGYINSHIHVSEIVIIAGAALGALIIMYPRKVLIDLVRKTIQSLKGAPYNKLAYEDLLKSL
jgi:hypothetical protein